MKDFNAETSSVIRGFCPWVPSPQCDLEEPDSFDRNYRRYDGSCNNLREPNLGRATTPFWRERPPQYGSSKGRVKSLEEPRKSVEGRELPSARTISKRLARRVKRPGVDEEDDPKALDPLQTVMVMQMGQFIDHDIAHSPMPDIDCCNEDGSYPGILTQLQARQSYPALPCQQLIWGKVATNHYYFRFIQKNFSTSTYKWLMTVHFEARLSNFDKVSLIILWSSNARFVIVRAANRGLHHVLAEIMLHGRKKNKTLACRLILLVFFR